MDTLQSVGSTSTFSDLCLDALEDIIDELSIGVVFEVHRSIKLNYFHLDDMFSSASSSINAPTVETDPQIRIESIPKLPLCTLPYCDIFGMPLNQKKQIDCSCPNCGRMVAATRLAPHLEKCMGMGRSSSRIASRRLTQMSGNHGNNSASMNHGGDSAMLDAFGLNELTRNSNSPSSGSEKASSSHKNQRVKSKKGTMGVSSSEGGDSYPMKKKKVGGSQQKLYKEAVKIVNSANSYPEYLALDADHCQKVLLSLCGVVDPSSLMNEHSKMCRKSLKCKLHSDYQRLELRNSVLESEEFVVDPQRSKVTESRIRNSDSMNEVFGDFDIEPQDDSIGESSNLLDPGDNIGNVFDNLSNWGTKSVIEPEHGIPTYPSNVFQVDTDFNTSISFLASKKDEIPVPEILDVGLSSRGKGMEQISPSKGKAKSSKKQKRK